MKRIAWVIIAIMAGMLIFGCEKQPAGPEETSELNQTVEALAPIGWTTNQIVTNTSEIGEVTSIASRVKGDGSTSLPGLGAIGKQASTMLHKAEFPERISHRLAKSAGDTLFFFVDDSIAGVRKALYYNSETGLARYYEVKYKFADWQQMQYDSTEIRADLNFTLDNDGDDKLIAWHQTQQFRSSFFIQSIVQQLTVTDFAGQEVVGAHLEKETRYQPDRFLLMMKQIIDLLPDQSGTLREEFSYNDGKFAYKTVTFRPDNTGEFEEMRRDGTRISGRFDSVEDDGEGYWEETTDFPDGRFVDQIFKSAQLSFDNSNASLTTRYTETITYTTGKSVTDSALVIAREENSTRYTTIHYYKHNGEHGTLDITEADSNSTLDGHWSTADGFYVVIHAEYYADNSGHVHFEVFASETAYQNGDAPLIVADYYFSPDGSGNGTLTHNGRNFDITFDDSGNGNISTDGQTKQIRLYQ